MMSARPLSSTLPCRLPGIMVGLVLSAVSQSPANAQDDGAWDTVPTTAVASTADLALPEGWPDAIYLPKGVRVLGISFSEDTAEIELSPQAVARLDEATLATVYDQFRTLFYDVGINSVRLTCKGKLLSSYLAAPPPVAPEPTGFETMALSAPETITINSLSGRKVAIGPSHGRYWNGSGWYWQRSDPCGAGEAVLEDTNSIRLMQFLYQYLSQDGCTVYVPRQLDESDCCHGGTGLAWWKMAAYAWLRDAGYPCSVWGSSSGSCTSDTGPSRYSDDIRARPLFADYHNTDIYISHHTNAASGTASGTITYRDTAMEHPEHEANSYTLAYAVQTNVCDVIKNVYGVSDWYNRGVGDSAGGFGEIRIPNRPACLVELAFHDNCTRDVLYLTDNWFRSLTQWAIYKAVCQYFGQTPTWDIYSGEYVSDTIPSTVSPGQVFNVSVTFRNRGVLWNSARNYRLGAVGDSDPFTAFNRVNLTSEVGPGVTHTFNFTMTAPTTPGTYTTDWRMVRDGVTWFGPTHSEQVTVSGSAPTTFIVESRSGGQNYANYSETGTWSNSTAKSSATGCTAGIGSRWCTIGTSAGTAVFRFTPAATGSYQVFTTNATTTNSGNPMIHQVTHSGGTANVAVCQNSTCNPNPCNTWYSLGVYTLNAGTQYTVTATGYTSAGSAPAGNAGRADAVKWESTGAVAPPTITQHPSAQNVCPGGTANFTVAATGEGTLTYQWQKNSVNLANGGHYSGATTTTLTVSSADGNDAANYRCVVTNAGGSTNSNQAALTLKAATAITQHPSNQTVPNGGTAYFSVIASGDGTLSYQWQKNSVNLSNGGHYSGATTATLTVSNCDSADAANYRCVVTGGCGTATSNQAALTVNPPVVYIVESRSGGVNYAQYSETGTWSNSTAKSTAAGCTAGIGSRWCTIGSTAKTAVFKFTPAVTDTYKVYTTNCNTNNSGNPMVHKVLHAGGTTSVNVCQNSSCGSNAINKWYLLGTFTLNGGTQYNVTLDGSTGAGSAPSGNAGRSDAIKWEQQ